MAIFTGLVIVFDTATGIWNYETLTVTDYDNYVGDGYQSNTPAIGTMTLNGDEVSVPFGEGTGYSLTFSYTFESGVSNNTYAGGLRLDDTHFILPIDNYAMTILPGIAIEDLADLTLLQVSPYATGVLPVTSTWRDLGLREHISVLPDPEDAPWDTGAQTTIVTGGTPVGVPQTGTETEVDLFLDANTRYSFLLRDEQYDPRTSYTSITIYDQNGDFISYSYFDGDSNLGRATLDFTPESSGVYTLGLDHYGYFSLGIDADDHGDSLETATQVSNGANIVAHLNGSDDDFYRVDLQAGETLSASVTDLPGYDDLFSFVLLDASGGYLEYESVSEGTASLGYTATTAETIYLRVFGSETEFDAGVSRYLLSLGDALPVQTYGAGNDAILIDMRSDDSAMFIDTGGSNTLTILADPEPDGVPRGFESNMMVGTAGGIT